MIAALEISTGVLMTVVGVAIAGMLLNVILAVLSRCLTGSRVGFETEGAEVIRFGAVGTSVKPMRWSQPISS